MLTAEEKEKILEPFLQKLQDELSKILGVSVAVCKVVDKEGKICFRLTQLPSTCQMIMATEKGMRGCNTSCQACNELVKEKGEALLVQCHVGFLGFYFPIFIEGERVGAITGCAGLIPQTISLEELREKYQKIAQDYNLEDKEKFLEEILTNTQVVSKEKIDQNLSLLKKVVEEIIETYKEELKSVLI
jgi:ligand-binding sensor protein